jgi:hypothetical protein
MAADATALIDLRDSIEYIRHRERELSLLNVDPTDGIHEELGAFFETQNVRITGNSRGKPRALQ